MTTALDSSILLDILDPDQVFGPASGEAMRRARQAGSLTVSAVVWAEVRAHFSSDDDHARAMRDLEVELSPLAVAAASRAGASWRDYRLRGGKRTRLIGDFLIGAHALVQADRLLTRDRGFYRAYFSSLKLLEPEID